MNGLGYGRFSGLSGSRHSINNREYANTYNTNGNLSQNGGGSPYGYALFDEQLPQQQQRHLLMVPGQQNGMSRFENAMFSAIAPNPQGRPYSAGSRISAGSRPPKKFRSYENFAPNQPLTKQVNQLLYEIPDYKFTKNALCQPPEFLKVFSDVRCFEGDRATFDCVLLGAPRPKVHWLFNDEKMAFEDVVLEDTSDVCRCTIKNVRPYHYGVYMVLAENEAGRALTTATLLPAVYSQF